MALVAVTSKTSSALCGQTAANVHKKRYGLKMRWIDAATIAAEMVYAQTCGNWPHESLV